MIKETKIYETVGFVVILFIIGGIPIGGPGPLATHMIYAVRKLSYSIQPNIFCLLKLFQLLMLVCHLTIYPLHCQLRAREGKEIAFIRRTEIGFNPHSVVTL